MCFQLAEKLNGQLASWQSSITLVELTSVWRNEHADAARASQLGEGHCPGSQLRIEQTSGLRRARARMNRIDQDGYHANIVGHLGR